MATTILYASSHFLARKGLVCESYVGPRARMVTTRDVQTVATPRRVLVRRANETRTLVVNVAATMGKMPKKRYTREPKNFVEEMRLVAIKMHTRDQVKVEEKNPKLFQDRPVSTWEFTLEKYLKFLVDSKLVFDTLEQIIQESTVPAYAGFKNTGLERADNLGRDLEWFEEQGYEIPEPMAHGKAYSQHLKDIAEKDPPAFICHFYNINFAHSAGGRMIGKKVSKMIHDNKELEFYKWDGQLSELLQNVREELNKVAELWTREEKNHCLEETEKSFKFYGEIIQILLS